MHTITLSKIEAACVERHLVVARDRLPSLHPDFMCIEVVLTKLRASSTFTLARQESFCLLRALRMQRHLLRIDMEHLEERRIRGGHNGKLDEAWRKLDVDAMMIDDVRRRLWDMI